MSLIRLCLSDDLTARLSREAKASKRTKADIARTAIADYLTRRNRERLLKGPLTRGSPTEMRAVEHGLLAALVEIGVA